MIWAFLLAIFVSDKITARKHTLQYDIYVNWKFVESMNSLLSFIDRDIDSMPLFSRPRPAAVGRSVVTWRIQAAPGRSPDCEKAGRL